MVWSRVRNPPGSSRKGPGRAPEASPRRPGSVWEAAGEAQRRKTRFLQNFDDFLENSGPVLGPKSEPKSTKIGKKRKVFFGRLFDTIFGRFWRPLGVDFWRILGSHLDKREI